MNCAPTEPNRIDAEKSRVMAGIEGLMLGRYELRRRIAQGGMAEVYLGYDRRVRRQVAVKVLYGRDEAFVRRFEREALAVGALTHHHILPLYDFGEQSPWYYLVMPYVEGGTLRDYLHLHNQLTLDEAASILNQIASALQYAHDQSVVHRDVKPSNILLRQDGYAYLVDFGLAKAFTGAVSLTGDGAMVGTPEYMAPEQSNGESEYRSDIYSLGVILYHMLTGHVPFTAESPVAVSLKHIQCTPTPPRTLNSDIPPAIEEVILKAMEKDPNKRYQQAQEFSQAYWEALQLERSQHSAEVAVCVSTQATMHAGVVHHARKSRANTGSDPHAPRPSHPSRPSQPLAAITRILEETRLARSVQAIQLSQHAQQAQQMQHEPPIVPLRMPQHTHANRVGTLAQKPLSTSLPPARQMPYRNRLLLRALLAFTCLVLVVVTLPLGLLVWQTHYHPASQKSTLQSGHPGKSVPTVQPWLTATAAAQATTQANLAAEARAQATAGISNSLGAGIVLYADTLTSPGGGWINDGSQCAFSPQGYHVRTYTSQVFAWCYSSAEVYTSAIITAQAQLLRGDTFGFVFRLNPSTRTFYVLEINSTGSYRFVRASGDNPQNWLTLIDWTPSSAIVTGYGNLNTMLMVANGSQFRFYLNRQLMVTSFTDTAYTSGMVGFLVGGDKPGGTEAVFSNIWVFQK